VKNVLFSILALMFLLPQVSNTFVWVHYQTNKAAITEQFCENKAKPELQCNGQCHLAKQLTEPVAPTSNQPTERLYLPQLDLFFLDVAAFETAEPIGKTHPNTPTPFYTFCPLDKIDEPPQA
jgi:hypothetical protein